MSDRIRRVGTYKLTSTDQPADTLDDLWRFLKQYPRKSYRPSELVEKQLSRLLEIMGGIEGVRNKLILDLGCGSKGTRDKYDEAVTVYEPWLCRALYHLGAFPLGIDLFHSEWNEEPFCGMRADLSLPGDVLSSLPDSSFHHIQNHRFLSDPAIPIQLIATSPYLFRETNPMIRSMMHSVLLEEAERLLRDGGTYTQHIVTRRKVNGVLQLIDEAVPAAS
jgi:hypothetical protein